MAVEVFDERSFTAKSVDLDRCFRAIGDREHVVRAASGTPQLADIARWAAQLHDLGKADTRFNAGSTPRARRGACSQSAHPKATHHRVGRLRSPSSSIARASVSSALDNALTDGPDATCRAGDQDDG